MQLFLRRPNNFLHVADVMPLGWPGPAVPVLPVFHWILHRLDVRSALLPRDTGRRQRRNGVSTTGSRNCAVVFEPAQGTTAAGGRTPLTSVYAVRCLAVPSFRGS